MWTMKVSVKPPRADVLAEASHHGFAEGPPTKLFGEGPPKKGVLAETMLVKSPKMVVTLVGKGDADVGTDAASKGQRSHVKMHLS